MAGADTWRGIAFQAALTTVRALDVLEGHLGEWLDVDTGDDIIDYSSGAAAGLVLVGQAKTRAQPGTWTPAEIAEIVRRLVATPDASEARIEFVTDGSLSQQSSSALLPALARVRDDEATNDDWQYLAGYGITAAAVDPLRRVSIVTRQDSAPALLDRAVRRVRALTDLTAPTDDSQAELRVLRLLRAIDDAGSSAEPAGSRLSRASIGAIVGVAPDVVDRARPWSTELAGEYRRRILEQEPAGIVELDAQLESLQPSVVHASTAFASQNEPPRHEPVLDLLDRNCLIIGPAGAGKTLSLQLLRQRAVREGLVPVLLAPRTYEHGALSIAVRDAVSRVLGFVVAPATGATLLTAQETVLIIDGASELPEAEMRRALGRDVEAVRSRYAAATVIVAGRSAGALRPLDLPTYRLVPLDAERRRQVAAELFLQDVSPLVAEIEDALREAAGNPLVFAMALHAAAEGDDVTSVSELYERSVGRLADRAQLGQEVETPLGVLGLACLDLVDEGRFALDRWAWLLALERAVERLSARGLIEQLRAVDVLATMERVGLLVPDADQSGYSLLHDSFRDWLAARAVARGVADRPPTFGPAWAAVAGHLAEVGVGDGEFLLACAEDLGVAAVAAAREAASNDDDPPRVGTNATLVLSMLMSTHLRAAHADAWSETEIVVRPKNGGATAYLIPTAAAGDMSAAIAGASFPEPAGPLRIAVTLFFERLRSLLTRAPSFPAPIPDDAAALAAAVEEHFRVQRDAVARLAEDLVPTLAERLQEHLGWRGLRGRVNPRLEEREAGANALHYTHDATDIVVDVSTDPLPESTRMTTAQEFLREAPERRAADAVATALAALLEGFDRT